jgi:hypothetical protein
MTRKIKLENRHLGCEPGVARARGSGEVDGSFKLGDGIGRLEPAVSWSWEWFQWPGWLIRGVEVGSGSRHGQGAGALRVESAHSRRGNVPCSC